MIDGIIFDIDGTILDSMEMWKNLDLEFLKSMNVTPDPDYTETVNKLTLEEGVTYTKNRYQLPLSEEEIMEIVRRMAMEFYYNRVELKSSAKEFLEELLRRKIPMSVATSSQKDFILHGLRRNGADHYFKEIFSGSDLGVNKYVPDLFLMAAESIGAAPENSWVFEDSYHAMKTAQRAGFKVAMVYDKSNEKFLEETIREADLYLGDLTDFERFRAVALT